MLTCLLPGVLSWGQNNLEVKVDNIKNDKGDIMVGLYTADNNFPRDASEGRVIKASKNGVTVVFLNIKPGTYAVSAMHDENGNKDLDQNKLGIPKEGFGFSNNARGVMGPPSFHKALIELQPGKKDTMISIDMKYMFNKN